MSHRKTNSQVFTLIVSGSVRYAEQSFFILFITKCPVSSKSRKLTGSVLVTAMGQYGEHTTQDYHYYEMKTSYRAWNLYGHLVLSSSVHSRFYFVLEVLTVTACVTSIVVSSRKFLMSSQCPNSKCNGGFHLPGMF